MGTSIVVARRDRCRKAVAVGDRRPWEGSPAQSEWATSFDVQAWGRCSSDDYIRVLPHLMGNRNPPACLLRHFSARLNVIGAGGFLRRAGSRWLVERSNAGAKPRAPSSTFAELNALLTTLRLGMAPTYTADLAAAVAYWIGLHPVYLWPEALVSHEMFLALGWMGLLRQRGCALMPVAVADYFADVIEIDGAGTYHVRENLLAAVMEGQGIRIAVADAAERRLRGDESLLRWPAPATLPMPNVP